MNGNDLTVVAQSANPTGRHFIPGATLQFGEQVQPGDLCDVDFDRRHLTDDGLYVFERLDKSGCPAGVGCRRFHQSIVSGWLVDDAGEGSFQKIKNTDPVRIIGRVLKVYRPTGC